ncbi:MAG: hypothetical protein JRC68_10165 [Deltaproteobacteria bacterium]|nr:hypothetical protein [Deltaproteobacteria bacterium]
MTECHIITIMEKELLKLKKKWKTWDRVSFEMGISLRTMGRYVTGSYKIPRAMQKLIVRMVAEIK